MEVKFYFVILFTVFFTASVFIVESAKTILRENFIKCNCLGQFISLLLKIVEFKY